jgi:alpha-amylase/alpha-mannosidase (GH57 family)
MNIWHDTSDAPRTPGWVPPGVEVHVAAGTWPIEPGQDVSVAWKRADRDGRTAGGAAVAQWQRNVGVNSYWTARLGPFADGDRVTYTVHGRSAVGPVETDPRSFRVRPLYIAWLWHQHQPLYRDPATQGPRPTFRYPWVRLHAIRDYYSMAALAAETDVHVTINLTPVLLEQIDDYVRNGATDTALELTRRPAETLTPVEVEDILSTFFDADWHHQVYPHARYRELFEQRAAGGRFSRQDVRDLQMWFNLAWFGHEFRATRIELSTGEVVTVDGFVRQGRGFSHDDLESMVEDQYRVLRAIVPIHRALQDLGRIEVSTTPAFHPILPLLIDTDRATVDRPGATLPPRFAYPEDAGAHLDLARADYSGRFGRPPLGMWPAEGAVSAEAVAAAGRRGWRWMATDAGVLARSGRWGYQTSDPDVLCQPYVSADELSSPAIFFRDTDLSDGVGFRYGQYADAVVAARDFMGVVEARYLHRFRGDGDRVLTIVLDGENAWGGYSDDGRPFLRELYYRLTTDPRVKTVTFAEYLGGNPSRSITAHLPANAARVHDLATGSWIDEPGSTAGVDLGTWIGEPEENAAWRLLGDARAELTLANPAANDAWASILAAEGSDWFWWFGSDQDSRNDAAFDDLFRAHLRRAYEAMGVPVPDALDDPIVSRPVVWTFTKPVSAMRHRDRVLIRTNCPGRLTYQIDDSSDVSEMTLAAVGGVMAGARRFQATLGPFVAHARQLSFRFVCEHPGCQHQSPCCRGDMQTILLRATTREAPGTRGRRTRFRPRQMRRGGTT